MKENLSALAGRNLRGLKVNTYPGRGIVVGKDLSGENIVQVYWIMGRSFNSRNRVFCSDVSGRVWTEAADPAKVTDPSLIIYTAMREGGGLYVVSNGVQTDTAFEFMGGGQYDSFHKAMHLHQYEPDQPNFTPRISAACSLRPGNITAEMAILKKSPWEDGCDRYFYSFPIVHNGIGLCLTTYDGQGDPLPAFSRRPYPLPFYEDPEKDYGIADVADMYWQVLNEENRVSLAVKFINLESTRSQVKIINKFSKA